MSIAKIGYYRAVKPRTSRPARAEEMAEHKIRPPSKYEPPGELAKQVEDMLQFARHNMGEPDSRTYTGLKMLRRELGLQEDWGKWRKGIWPGKSPKAHLGYTIYLIDLFVGRPLSGQRRLVPGRQTHATAVYEYLNSKDVPLETLQTGLRRYYNRINPEQDVRNYQSPVPSSVSTTPDPIFHSSFRKLFDAEFDPSLRIAELDDIESELKSSNIAILRGLPGVGKTSIINHFVHQHRGGFPIGIWRTAFPFLSRSGDDDQTLLRASLLEFLKALEAQQPALVEKWGMSSSELTALDHNEKLDTLAATLGDGILFVFDNVPNPHSVREPMRILKKSKIIISTNFSTWTQITGLNVIEMRSLKDEVGGKYLRDNIKDANSSPDQGMRLSRALGGLPLALRHAISFCRETGESIANYQKNLVKRLDDKGNIPHPLEAEGRGEIAIAAQFDMAIREACSLESSAELAKTSTYRMIGRASILANSEWIPTPLLIDEDPQTAIRNLQRFSLIDTDETTQHVHVHTLVKHAVRRRMSQPEREAALTEIISAILRFGESRPPSSQLIPTIVDVLALLRTDEFRNSDVRDRAEEIGDLLCALVISGDDLEVVEWMPELFVTAISEMYAVNPLSKIFRLFVERVKNRGRIGWETLQDQLLKSSNYVLSFTLAENLATAWKDDRLRLSSLLADPGNINRFELGAFALGMIYARHPDLVEADASIIRALASDGTYVGKAILGRLFTHLIINQFRDFGQLKSLYSDNSYWKTKWGFVRTTVIEVKAAAVMYEQVAFADDDEDAKEIEAEVVRLRSINRRIGKLLESELGPDTKSLFSEGSFLLLAANTEKIDDAYEELRQIEDISLLVEIIDVLFGHPIFNVAETAATKLRDIILQHRSDTVADEIFPQLFAKDHWRSHYGATETAFQLRLTKPKFFRNSVEKFFAHNSCRVRGLCAENLISTILAASTDKALMMLGLKEDGRTASYRFAIDRWLDDDDCWVLDHVYRLFSELNRKLSKPDQQKLAELASGKISRSFPGKLKWFYLPRIEFLRTIEEKKSS
jgi:hypothetical protein